MLRMTVIKKFELIHVGMNGWWMIVSNKMDARYAATRNIS